MPELSAGDTAWMLVATALVASQWHRVARLDPLLHQPWRWFAPTLWRLPLIALAAWFAGKVECDRRRAIV